VSVLLALMAALVYGVSDFLGGLASRGAKALTVLIYNYPFGALIMVALLPFFPGHVVKELLVAALALAVVVVLAWKLGPPLEAPASREAEGYQPRPEWYFLGLFQLLKLFEGRAMLIGTALLPGLVAALVALLPWLDRNPERKAARPKFSYFPFGGGPRGCIGSQFAMIEAQLVVATVVQSYEMDLVVVHPVVPDPTFTLRPKFGVRVILRRRG
jgi:quinol-cytochrome oxidoreductase complex cytochrome b subunit